MRNERLRRFDNGREEQNLSNSQVLPQMATDEGNPRLSRREMERMSKSTSNIPNVIKFDNVRGKSLSNVPTGRSRQESKSLSNVPPGNDPSDISYKFCNACILLQSLYNHMYHSHMKPKIYIKA